MGRRKKDNSGATGSHVEILQPQGVVIGDHAKVVQNFGGPRRLPAASEIRDACINVTKRLVGAIVEDRKLITRETLTNEIDEFLSSKERYCFIRGPSGVGKSISVATEAERLIEAGFIVLLISGKDFSLQEAAQQVAGELWPPVTKLSWQKLIEILVQDDSKDARGLVLSVDGIDEADDLHQISLQLTKLHESLGSTPPDKIKIILSCRDIAWGRFSKQRLMPLYEDFDPSIPGSKKHFGGYSSRLITLRDFTTTELDRALHVIGANELINPGRFGADPSAHIATLRSLLRHPATFEHYSALRRNNDAIAVEKVTWSYLIEKRLRKALDKAGHQCQRSVQDLRKLLERMTLLSWQRGSKNFELDREELQSAIPELSCDENHEGASTLAALVEHRILSESVVNNQSRISFNIADIGGYLLSFELERQTQDSSPEEIHTLLMKWLDESRDFQPLLDALLALMDRFANQPYSSRSLALVEVLVESHRFQSRSLFGLMRPEVLKTIFEIIKQPDGHELYGYRDAALGIRPSLAALTEIRSHLNGENQPARQLAAELAGALHDKVAIEELIRLFRDPDKNIRRKVFEAFGHIGKSAVGPLLRTINDSSQPVELRGSCITALRNVGFRNSEGSVTLRSSFEHSEGEPELLVRSLLAAAGLRDQGHSKYAIRALESRDEQVVTSAAKYLTELPNAKAFPALRRALSPKTLALREPHERFWIITQLMVALWQTDKVRATPLLLEIIANALQGKGDLLPLQVMQLPNKIDLPAVPPLIFKEMVKQLQQGEKGDLVWRSSRALGATWRTRVT